MGSDKKISIVYILTKLELGGAQKHTVELIKGLDKNKFCVHLITSDGLLSEEVKKVTSLDLILVNSLKREIDLVSDVVTLFRIRNILRSLKPSIVHTHSSKAGLIGRWAAWLSGVPVIIHTIHGFEFHDYQWSPIKRFYVFLERITAIITDKLIAVSDNTFKRGITTGIGLNGNRRDRVYLLSNIFKEFGKSFWRTPKTQEDVNERKTHKYIIIKYGIPKETIPAKEADVFRKKEAMGIDNNAPVVGMVSCFKPQKSPLDFIRLARVVMKEYPQARFILVGDGVLKRPLIKLIGRLGLKESIILTGFRKDALEIISIFDIFVLTSLWEGLPIVFLEAMALSKPIVATDTGPQGELVRDGYNGYLVKPGDYLRLAERVTFLLKNRELSREIGLNGNHFLKENGFFTERMLGQTVRLYESLLEKAKS